ncbi:hypothetical protein VP1G_11398 [Cytospora mali]|uniref:Uncharacterized protein n=1 Tax=Cytospora mali TaxID=578113 RepID=A0A194VF10_CYTMA|nr:hypothetical protein VP1G_11398 [Valsa mali var. pyri (nom. inval.)]
MGRRSFRRLRTEKPVVVDPGERVLDEDTYRLNQVDGDSYGHGGEVTVASEVVLEAGQRGPLTLMARNPGSWHPMRGAGQASRPRTPEVVRRPGKASRTIGSSPIEGNGRTSEQVAT